MELKCYSYFVLRHIQQYGHAYEHTDFQADQLIFTLFKHFIVVSFVVFPSSLLAASIAVPFFVTRTTSTGIWSPASRAS